MLKLHVLHWKRQQLNEQCKMSGGVLGRRFKTSQQQLNHKQLATKFYSDTLFPKVKSLRGNTCAQLFCTSDGYAKV
jgi:hypothetical protein